MFGGRDTGFSQSLDEDITTIADTVESDTLVPDTASTIASAALASGESSLFSTWRSPSVARHLADIDQLPPSNVAVSSRSVGIESTSAPRLATRPVAQTVRSVRDVTDDRQTARKSDPHNGTCSRLPDALKSYHMTDDSDEAVAQFNERSMQRKIRRLERQI